MEAEGEARYDAEVAATATERPEQVVVLVRRGAADLAVRGHDLDLLEVVDCPAEAACQIAETTAERQAGEAGLGDEAEHGGQPVLLGRAVDVVQEAARLDVGQPALDVHLDVLKSRHVECKATVGERRPCNVVPAALYREQDSVRAGEPNCLADVVGGEGLYDDGRPLRDHAVPNADRPVEAGIAREEHRPVEPRREGLQ